jgi:hypothetical protein
MLLLNQKAPVETEASGFVYPLFYFFEAFFDALAFAGFAVKTINPRMAESKPTS